MSGCASVSETLRELPDPGIVIELAETPFYPQKKYQCGPAALATVLTGSGVSTGPDELAGKVYLPGRKGSLQVEMLAATRTAGRLPYLLEGTLAAIVAQLEEGRPVVVLQNLGVSLIPRWHYAVVIGLDGERDEIILRSGTDKRRTTRTDVFLRTWGRSDYWGFTVLRPGEIPSSPDRQRYFEAVSGLEQAGQHPAAATAWRAALSEWPGDPVATFGLANALLADNAYRAAEAVYRELLETRPELVVARNNLAMTLARQHRFEEALAEIQAAIQQAADTPIAAELADTEKEIRSMAATARQ